MCHVVCHCSRRFLTGTVELNCGMLRFDQTYVLSCRCRCTRLPSTRAAHSAHLLTPFLTLCSSVPSFGLQVQEICHLVGQRSGRLVAAGLAALMRQMGRDGSHGPPKRTVVGVDGGIFRHYPQFREALQQGLVDLLGQQVANKV